MAEKHNQSIRDLADQIVKSKGLKDIKHDAKAPFNEEKAKKIAHAFQEMKHEPNNPKVKAAYNALIDETVQQYQQIRKAGLKVTPIGPDMKNPYANSSEMLKDVKDNHHLYFYPTDQGFGGKEDKTNDHPLLRPTKENINGKPLLANDVFRIVHDYFGHAKEGTTFGPKGEEAAWHSHKQMYSPEAIKALTTETRGQNSWVNFGPHGEANRANPVNTQYAEQKAGLLPDWALQSEEPEVHESKPKKMAAGGFVSDADFAAMPSVDNSSSTEVTGQSLTGQPKAQTPSVPEGFISDADFAAQDQAANQPIQAGVEGALSGLLTKPGAALLEKKFGIATPEGIRAREAAHPIAHGVGETAGLIGGSMLGTGEGAALEGAGKLATEAAGLSAPATYAAKVGSSVVKNAAELAAYQGQDEAGKMVLQDPDAGAASAISNIGLATALGGGLGAIGAGVISPIWKATNGAKVEELLQPILKRLNGGNKLEMTADKEAAAQTLGIELEPVIRSGMSDAPAAGKFFGDLRRGEHDVVLDAIHKTHSDIANSVIEPLGVTPEEALNYSENEGGRSAREAFIKESKAKYDQPGKLIQQRDAEAFPIQVPDENRLEHAGRLVEKGINDVGTDSPYFKEYQHYADRLLARDTIGEIDQLRTEIFGRMKAASRAGDDNTWKALSDIRGSLGDFQTNQIEAAAREADKAALAKQHIPGLPRINVGGIDSAIPDAEALIARRAEANKQYAQYAGIMDTVMDHLGLGEFKGNGKLLSKVAEGLSPEEIFKKFTIKGNADLTGFLAQHFPDTLAEIVKNERKQLIKPAMLSAAKKGEMPIDVKKLSDIIQANMAGKPEYVKTVLPDEVIKRVEAGKILANAIPSPKDSGTPAGLSRIFRSMPANAIAAISWATGHGVIGGALAGEMAQRLGKDAPEAIKLAYLKMLSSEKPISAEGFKSAVDYFDSARKGAKAMSEASANIFKPGAMVLSAKAWPSAESIAKLDKLVASNDPKTTNGMIASQEGPLGHYMPEHQTAMAANSLRAVQYLKTLKPNNPANGPLDKPLPATAAQEARYNRALEIGQQPAVVLQRIKDGTLQTSDIVDIQAMYPNLYAQMAQKLSNDMISHVSDDQPISYKTKMSMSLFLGQPLDTSMQPASIIAAQPKLQQPPQTPGKKGNGPAAKLNKLDKSVPMHMTPTEASQKRQLTHE